MDKEFRSSGPRSSCICTPWWHDAHVPSLAAWPACPDCNAAPCSF